MRIFNALLLLGLIPRALAIDEVLALYDENESEERQGREEEQDMSSSKETQEDTPYGESSDVHATVSVSTVETGTALTFNKAPAGMLHSLLRITKDFITSEEYFAPVARSYNGYDWENVAGPYSPSDIPITCTSDSCTFTIPTPDLTALSSSSAFLLNLDNYTAHDAYDRRLQMEDIIGVTFELYSFPSPNLDAKTQVARFLEQTTFGTTEEEIQTFNLKEPLHNQFPNWIQEQMNEPPTSHRSLFRKRIETRRNKPTIEAALNHPCKSGSRWRAAAFSREDVGKTLVIQKISGSLYSLSVDGHVRTIVDKDDFILKNNEFPGIGSFRICKSRRALKGDIFALDIPTLSCTELKQGTPSIDLHNYSPMYVMDINENDSAYFRKYDANEYDLVEFVLMKNQTISSVLCDEWPGDTTPFFVKLSTGQYLINDLSLLFIENDLSSVSPDGGGSVSIDNGITMCSNAPRTFQNTHSCRISDDPMTCSIDSSSLDEQAINLDPNTIRELHRATDSYIYIIRGLRYENDSKIPPPCTSNVRSRWVPLPQGSACNENFQKTSTRDAFRTAIANSKDLNPYFRDIYAPKCDKNDIKLARKNLNIFVHGKCWKLVHPHEFNVYDFTEWVAKHPGGQSAIKKWAEDGSAELNFPGPESRHAMLRWHTGLSELKLFGRMGDSVKFLDLPAYFRNNYRIQMGYLLQDKAGVGALVCGSPGESSNDDPLFSTSPGWRVSLNEVDESKLFDFKAFVNFREDVWSYIAIKSKDQLRQRMAWALSQLFAVSPSAFGETANTEMFLSFYDIFVRHAFGNFRDILKEVSYSPLMADMLTFHQSKSTEYVYKTTQEIQYPDENFAREVMQLFSIGLLRLNSDGSHYLDMDGHTVQTYSNDDILEYARSWTGFTRQDMRGNIEEQEGGLNSVDPMKIILDWRDMFPKQGLDGKYIGDFHMLCSDVPAQSYLRKGTSFRLLGKSKLSDLRSLSVASKTGTDIKVVILDQDSALRKKLCIIDSVGQCKYSETVKLDENLSCFGIECSLDHIEVIQVADGIFYEFVNPPCVQMAFFEQGRMVSPSVSSLSQATTCVDMDSRVGASACCASDDTIATFNTCKYTGEKVSFGEAVGRCDIEGKSLCEFSSVSTNPAFCGDCCNYKGFYWYGTNACEVYIVVDNAGRVAFERQGSPKQDYTSLTFFRVNWTGIFPSQEENCGDPDPICEVVDSFCRCRIQTGTETVFSGDAPISKTQVLEKLFVGGPPPSLIDYASTIEIHDMKVHFYTRDSYDQNVIFELFDINGQKKYLKNSYYRVTLKSSTGEIAERFSFRNAPTFYSASPNRREAQYEIDATLDHYTFHPNHAPFLSKYVIQKFGISNPSPGYIQRAAEAYSLGTYKVTENVEFGSGQYGDLSALLAAVVLDRESRDITLDKDISFGSIREPIIKAIALFRNMNFVKTSEELLSLPNAKKLIGQAPYNIPDVFSFFWPNYAPQGSVSKASLVAPEAMMLGYSKGLINAHLSLVKFGLTECWGGLANYCSSSIQEGSFNNARGHLSWKPTNWTDTEVIDQLSTILTSGRLNTNSRELILKEYNKILSTTENNDTALRFAQQLILTSPEYHTTGSFNNSLKKRPRRSYSQKSCKKYKAVIHLLLEGGLDSFNMLVPYSGCKSPLSYDQYAQARGSVKLSLSSLLPIDATNQPCTKFGLHPRLSAFQKLYNDNDLAFVAGIGVLTQKVSQKDWDISTKTTLFSHNDMRMAINELDPKALIEGTGVLGRISDVLAVKDFSVNAFAIEADVSPLIGTFQNKSIYSMDPDIGWIDKLDPSDDSDYMGSLSEIMNGQSLGKSSVMAESWAKNMLDARDSEFLYHASKNATQFETYSKEIFSRQFKPITEMIGSRVCRGSDRDIFHLSVKHCDFHSNLLSNLDQYFIKLNSGIEALVNELKAMNEWQNTVIVVTSDFGRTLSGNTNKGTDHGWSGHSIILGGSVKGGKIYGTFPSDVSSNSNLDVGRGRFIPEHPWEYKWNAVSEWLGVVEKSDLNHILPNRETFDSMLSMEDIFEDTSFVSPCEDEGSPISCIPGFIFDLSSSEPSLVPSKSLQPSLSPTSKPSFSPSTSMAPSKNPTDSPTTTPSLSPRPSIKPSTNPSTVPSSLPSVAPSDEPSRYPSSWPSNRPTSSPSFFPSKSLFPTTFPSAKPSIGYSCSDERKIFYLDQKNKRKSCASLELKEAKRPKMCGVGTARRDCPLICTGKCVGIARRTESSFYQSDNIISDRSLYRNAKPKKMKDEFKLVEWELL